MKLSASDCPFCHKPQVLMDTQAFSNGEIVWVLKCGHFIIKHKLGSDHEYTKNIAETKEAFPYQKDGVKFIQDADYNCLIADQMGLGKTIQSLLALRNAYEKLTPCLILVKSATTWQWVREYKDWCSSLPLGVYVISSAKAFIPPGFGAYVLSMDTLGREGMVDKLLKFGFKLVIVDEAHSFKNPESKRSQSLIQFLHEINKIETVHNLTFTCGLCKHQWDESITVRNTDLNTYQNNSSFCPSCNAQVSIKTSKERIEKPKRKCNVIMLSGTPIVNRADEYFVPLNILAPEKFNSLDRFRKNWLIPNEKGKYTRIDPHLLTSFKETIEPFVLRRERNEVLKDLPPFSRLFKTVLIENEELRKLYNLEIEKMALKDATKTNVSFVDLQDNIASLRRLAGLAKLPYVVDYVGEFMDETENEKIVLGIHHKDVRHSLKYMLRSYSPLTLSGEDNPEQKEHIVQTFKGKEKRILIANTLAGGVGLNLQFCNNALVLERQWSSASEEQFEGRFNRPGQTLPVTCEYLIVKSTIDEYFHDLVEQKRQIFGETIENNFDPMAQSSASDFVSWSMANKL